MNKITNTEKEKTMRPSAGSPRLQKARPRITLERSYNARIEDVWDLWTTKKGLESWWGPEGFTTTVRILDLRPGGKFEYAMTATGPEQVEAMKAAGLPLTSAAHGTYTEVTPRRRLAYTTIADFIPGVKPYEVAAQIEFVPEGSAIRIVVTEDAMHNDEWTEMSKMGMSSSLDKLGKVLGARRVRP
jgi:uncharacterized protein YndB with AHSA1/START domain